LQKFKMWINGKFVNADSGKTFTTPNPSTGEEISEVPLAGTSDVDKAIAAARQAFPAWSRKAQGERSDIVVCLAQLVKKHLPELMKLETMEHGSPVGLAQGMLDFAVQNIEFAAAISRNNVGEVLPDISNKGEPGQTEPDVVSYLKREAIGAARMDPAG
jgi:acyl-CoA reductase-like NAD-dependent aldehyde dehydrogenase